jgi:hypothetical protein
MDQLTETVSTYKPIPVKYLLGAMRCARLRASLLINEIDTIGCALKNELVTPDMALVWLGDVGAYPFLAPEIGAETA